MIPDHSALTWFQSVLNINEKHRPINTSKNFETFLSNILVRMCVRVTIESTLQNRSDVNTGAFH